MKDYESRRIIEALRSGISSREAGHCFSSARPALLRSMGDALDGLAHGRGGGSILSGKYGEGKTHLLNTVLSMAHERNMAVSQITLSKETPLSNLPLLYAKALQGLYLPGQFQPGLSHALEALYQHSPAASAMLETCLTSLETNKLYYVLKSYLSDQEEEEKYLLLADMEGDFMANAQVKRIYRRLHGEPAVFNQNFVKTRHAMDYFKFASYFLRALGYDGWVLLFDEAELIGRLGKKARQKAYAHMHLLLNPASMAGAYSLFAFNASYVPDVIEGKHEYESLDESALGPEQKAHIQDVLRRIEGAPQLTPLKREEYMEIFDNILKYHGKAFDWAPVVTAEEIFSFCEKHGYLLRTRIRTAVEFLDQLYQYGEAGDIHTTIPQEPHAMGLEEFLGE